MDNIMKELNKLLSEIPKDEIYKIWEDLEENTEGDIYLDEYLDLIVNNKYNY